ILSIFLSFRNTACYERWWEGRKLWGALIATTRHLCRDSHVLDDQTREVLLYRMMLFSHLLRDRLRQQVQSIQHYQTTTHFEIMAFDQWLVQINPPSWVLARRRQEVVTEYMEGNASDVLYCDLKPHDAGYRKLRGGC